MDRLRAVTPSEVTFSAGVASLDPDEKPKEFLNRADEALYQAKRKGRDRVERAAPAGVEGTGAYGATEPGSATDSASRSSSADRSAR